MPKRKKAKEQPLNDAESLTGASKDIDDIFSIKKSISLPLGYPEKGINKTTKLQSPSSRQPMSTDSYIAIIQSKVQAAKSKPPDELPPVQQDDDFADLRGFKNVCGKISSSDIRETDRRWLDDIQRRRIKDRPRWRYAVMSI